jgi:hypothetical protein
MSIYSSFLKFQIVCLSSIYSPTDSIKNKPGTIPEELAQVMWNISRQIPVCIISSKDYHFLHPRAKFARILSCIMGIETLGFKIDERITDEVQGAKVELVEITTMRYAVIFRMA